MSTWQPVSTNLDYTNVDYGMHNFSDIQHYLSKAFGVGVVGDISIPVGWLGLLECFSIFAGALPEEIRSGVTIQQIKEKHGTLRIYCYAPDEIFELVGAAELASYAICGVCGGAGCMRGPGWISVRCDAHTQQLPCATRRVAAPQRQIDIALRMLGDVLGHRFLQQDFEASGRMSLTAL